MDLVGSGRFAGQHHPPSRKRPSARGLLREGAKALHVTHTSNLGVRLTPIYLCTYSSPPEWRMYCMYVCTHLPTRRLPTTTYLLYSVLDYGL